MGNILIAASPVSLPPSIAAKDAATGGFKPVGIVKVPAAKVVLSKPRSLSGTEEHALAGAHNHCTRKGTVIVLMMCCPPVWLVCFLAHASFAQEAGDRVLAAIILKVAVFALPLGMPVWFFGILCASAWEFDARTRFARSLFGIPIWRESFPSEQIREVRVASSYCRGFGETGRVVHEVQLIPAHGHARTITTRSEMADAFVDQAPHRRKHRGQREAQ